MPRNADSVWKYLNGIICVYKDPDTSIQYISHKIRHNLCNDLNSLETRPPSRYVAVNRSASGISVNVRPSYADNVLCVGPRFQPQDINIRITLPLSRLMSGVQLVGINKGWRVINVIRNCNFTKCFQVKGILGQATNNFHIDGKVIARAKFQRIQRNHLEKILANYQSATQRRIFHEYNIDLKSQEAYEFAIKGLYRPKEKGTTIIYGLKIVKFEPPDFTIEVQCMYETEDYLKNLIHNLGVSLKCLATCSGIRCIRYGCFHVQDALLCKHWTLDNIIDNMKLCFRNLEEHFPDVIKHQPTVTASLLKCS